MKTKDGDGNVRPNQVIEYTWIDIPLEFTKESVGRPCDTYMVNPKVADYIDKLEAEIIKNEEMIFMLTKKNNS